MSKSTLTQSERRSRELQRKKKWRDENAEHRAAYIKAWRARNRERVTAYSASYVPSATVKTNIRASQKRYYENVVKKDPNRLAIRNARSKVYDATHPETVKAKIRRYQQKNRELLAAKATAAYHAKSPEQRKVERDARAEYYKQWIAANKERISAERRAKYDKVAQRAAYKKNYAVKRVEYIQRANARQRLLVGRGKFTQQDVDRLYEQQSGECTGCKVSLAEGYEIDHVMPISLGGSNTADNLQLLCMPCNRRKHDMHPDDWTFKLKSA